MAGPYSDAEKKKYLGDVKKLLGQGYSLRSACRQVADRHGGRPSETSLVKWAKAAGLENGAETAPAAVETTQAEEHLAPGTERGGSTPIVGDSRPEKDAQEQIAEPAPEPFPDTDESERDSEVEGEDDSQSDSEPEIGAESKEEGTSEGKGEPEGEGKAESEGEGDGDLGGGGETERIQASPVSVMEAPEEKAALREDNPSRLRGVVTTVNEKIRGLRNFAKGRFGR